jgi:dienelactone hydrolase
VRQARAIPIPIATPAGLDARRLPDTMWHDAAPWSLPALGGGAHTVEVALLDRIGRSWTRRVAARPDAGTLVLDPAGILPFLAPADGRGYWRAVASDPSVLSRPVMADLEPIDVAVTVRAGDRHERWAQARRQVHPDHPPEVVATGEGARGLFFPAAAPAAGVGLVTLPGSGGGLDAKAAALLAADGFDVLALGLFAHADLPASMARLRIDHVASGIGWLRARLGHDRIGLRGISKGSEVAAWTAILCPDLVKALILWVPSPMATSGRGDDGRPTALCSFAGRDLPWGSAPFPADASPADHSRARPFAMDGYFERMWRDPANAALLLPVERARCPMLLVSGGRDGVWPSQLGAEMIAARLASEGYRHPVTQLAHRFAGHLFNVPLAVESRATVTCHPVQRWWLRSGGTPRANAAAATRAWAEMQDFLRARLSAPGGEGRL